MDILKTIAELRTFVAAARRAGKTVSFVPTMGALHDGHIHLVREGLKRADICIPYIFLNPKQFAPTEDLANYPKTLEADLEKLRAVPASAVYVPNAEEIYPADFTTAITVSGITAPLEGECRPHFFIGVATVVAKMLLQCLPDVALFGEKDYQQLLVIKKMVRDMNIPVDIVGVPTVRDENGLALSSRNAYLTPDQYQIAIHLNRVLDDMLARAKTDDDIAAIERYARQTLLDKGFEKVDYITLRDADTLQPPEKNTKHLRVLAAAWLGRARLIDNKGE